MNFVRCEKCNRILPYSRRKPRICVSCRPGRPPRKKIWKPGNKIETKAERKIRYEAELKFLKNYSKPKNLIAQPAMFRFDNTSYQPDFYDKERNIFYEIVGTRQAFHQNESRIKKFKTFYPHIILEVIFDYRRN